jgi:hypothetical protein
MLSDFVEGASSFPMGNQFFDDDRSPLKEQELGCRPLKKSSYGLNFRSSVKGVAGQALLCPGLAPLTASRGWGRGEFFPFYSGSVPFLSFYIFHFFFAILPSIAQPKISV